MSAPIFVNGVTASRAHGVSDSAYYNTSAPSVSNTVATYTSNIPKNAVYAETRETIDLQEHETLVRRLQSKIYDLERKSKEVNAPLRNDCTQLRAELAAYTHNKAAFSLAQARFAEESNAKASAQASATSNQHQALLEERDLLAMEVANLERELLEGASGVRWAKSQMHDRMAELEAELIPLRMQAQDFARLRSDNIRLIKQQERLTTEIHHLEVQLRDSGRPWAEVHDLRIENERLLLEAERYYKLKSDCDFLVAENERLLMDDERYHKLKVDYDYLLAENERLRAELGRKIEPEYPQVQTDTRRPMLGVEIKMLDDAAGQKDCVVVVHSVSPNGPAEQAGLQQGDILTDWDGIALDSKAKFQRLLQGSPPGTKIVLSVLRGHSSRDVPVTVGGAAAGSIRQVRKVKSETVVDDFVQDHGAPGYRGLR